MNVGWLGGKFYPKPKPWHFLQVAYDLAILRDSSADACAARVDTLPS